MRHKKLIIASVFGLSAAAVYAQTALPCWRWAFRSCGALLANTDRVCDFGGMNLLCGDVVTQDNEVSTIKASSSGSSDFVNGAVVNVMIQRRMCDETTQTCVTLGPPEANQCTGEEPGPTDCGAQSIE